MPPVLPLPSHLGVRALLTWGWTRRPPHAANAGAAAVPARKHHAAADVTAQMIVPNAAPLHAKTEIHIATVRTIAVGQFAGMPTAAEIQQTDVRSQHSDPPPPTG